MKAIAFAALCLLGVSAFVSQCSAQTNAPAAAARRGPRIPPIRSAEITADGKVTFRLRAPKATEVLVTGQWPDGKAAMTKDTNGVWSVTVGPVPAGVWEYSFQMDGFTMIDPANPAMKPMREPRTSILQVPGNPPLLTDFQDVPHGVVRLHTYQSKALGRLRELVVYTPPGYDEKTRAKFPTLYLLHGSGDNQATWTVHGKAHWMLDNLIAQGKAKPMVIVMMDGHAIAPGGGEGAFNTNTVAFERDLLEDVMPFVEKNYRVKKDAADRAIVGLSMGGGQSLTIGLNHTDLFAWVGGFSSAAPTATAIEPALHDPAATNRKLKLLWIACGKDDFLLKRNQDFVALLQEKKLNPEWHMSEGAHAWPVWRGYLSEFAPRLFQ